MVASVAERLTAKELANMRDTLRRYGQPLAAHYASALLDEIDALTADCEALRQQVADAAAREVALTQALRRNRDDFATFNDACAAGLFAHHGFTQAVTEIDAALADPSAAAQRLTERLAALERVVTLAGIVRDKAAYAPDDDSAMSVREWDDLVAGVDALRAMDEEPR